MYARIYGGTDLFFFFLFLLLVLLFLVVFLLFFHGGVFLRGLALAFALAGRGRGAQWLLVRGRRVSVSRVRRRSSPRKDTHDAPVVPADVDMAWSEEGNLVEGASAGQPVVDSIGHLTGMELANGSVVDNLKIGTLLQKVDALKNRPANLVD